MLASTLDADCLTHLHSSTTIHAYMTSHLALLCRSCDAWPGRLPKALLGEISTPGVLLPGSVPASGLPGDEPHAAASAEAGMHTDTCFRAVLSSMQCICLSRSSIHATVHSRKDSMWKCIMWSTNNSRAGAALT